MARALDLLSSPESEEYAGVLREMFGVDFDGEAIERWRTAGDMLREIEARAAPSDMRGPAPAAKAFYLLRRAVGDRAVRPSTPLRAVKGTWRGRRFWCGCTGARNSSCRGADRRVRGSGDRAHLADVS